MATQAGPSWSVTCDRRRVLRVRLGGLLLLTWWAALLTHGARWLPSHQEPGGLVADRGSEMRLNQALPLGWRSSVFSKLYALGLLHRAQQEIPSTVAYYQLVQLLTSEEMPLEVRFRAALLLRQHYGRQAHLRRVLWEWAHQSRVDPVVVLAELASERTVQPPLRAAAAYSLAFWLMKHRADRRTTAAEVISLLELAHRLGQVVADPGDARRSLADSTLQFARRLPLLAGQEVPDIGGRTLCGAFRRLSDFRGYVVLLYFWGAW
jgi:hypothetical protein